MGKEDEDPKTPPAPVIPVTKVGDLILLGEHRLLCGDATNGDDVRKLLGELLPTLMVTDPPYAVNYDPLWRERAGKKVGKARGTVENDDRADWNEAYKHFPGDVCYIWHADGYISEIAKSVEDCGFKIKTQIIWAKQHFAISRADYHWKHEACLYCVRKGKKSNWRGGRKQTTLWEIQNLSAFGGNKDEEATGHGTQKPLECMRRPIENNSAPGEVVYDPFVGSGTTLIAAEKTKRRCVAMEIHPGYCDLVVERWELETGKQAVRP